MNDNISDSIDTSDASALKDQEIARLEELVQDLRDEVSELSSHKDRLQIEAKLAIEDAELARNFSRKSYAPLLSELFEKPSKELVQALRKESIKMVAIAVAVSLLCSYLFSAIILAGDNQDDLTQKLEALMLKTDQLLVQQQAHQHSPSTTTAPPNEPAQHSLPANDSATGNSNTRTVEEEINSSAIANEPEPLSPKQVKINQQAQMILSYIKASEQKDNFPKNYTQNKTALAQLYLIIMQHVSDESLYYEAYLQVMAQLNIDDSIRPKAIEDLLAFDTDFLQATYSAYLVTSKKLAKGWRYRDTDNQFSSYYSSKLDYNLGGWQIANNAKDYKTLPKKFLLNIQRMAQQLRFNEQTTALALPKNIYYHAYKQDNKNNAVSRLIVNTSITRSGNMLVIDLSTVNRDELIPAGTVLPLN